MSFANSPKRTSDQKRWEGSTPPLGATLTFPPLRRAKRTSLIPWRSVAFYEFVPSTKTQNEENRAVLGRELLWAVCGFKNEAVGTPLGAYEGQSKL
jgi:hypothetical protein